MSSFSNRLRYRECHSQDRTNSQQIFGIKIYAEANKRTDLHKLYGCAVASGYNARIS